jgi:hypothetical protein
LPILAEKGFDNLSQTGKTRIQRDVLNGCPKKFWLAHATESIIDAFDGESVFRNQTEIITIIS